ncbi:hypothetical protein OE88DRAFT_1734567 [Heliocybe sulcata]|uniref:Uncharacterized protein n=1 Tax=Heliocybe sulcata TaxID=5364 RepID=A0A5C3N7X6_9AGAM|nr:hypothetical protein OE88DRAFT_1734567 [Heliocybe sulcata]
MAMISVSPSTSPPGLRGHSRQPSGDTASAMQGPLSGLSGSLDDPTSSLRAAALMSLKSKRRKPIATVEHNVLPSTRPVPAAPDIQLDYGDEASSSLVNGSRAPISSLNIVSVATSDPGPSADVAEIEEGQIREEGEISDTEAPPPGAPPFAAPPTEAKARSPKTQQAAPTPTLAARLGLNTADSQQPPTPVVSQVQPVSGFSPNEAATHLSPAATVRPGLALNAQQYEIAKDIILDLLGWGVPPEFLVSCGLSREIVFYVFSDLNLRLPANLDTTGLIPDSTGEDQPFAPSPAPPGSLRNDSQHFHPNLPSKPIATHSALPSKPATSSSSVPELGTTGHSTARAPSTNGTNLHDIEQLRRQELLARKAVQASRKAKQPILGIETSVASAEAPSVAATFSGVDISTAVPDESVDDFLKSIGPNSSVLPRQQLVEEPSDRVRSASRDVMDVDTPLLEAQQQRRPGDRPLSARSVPSSSPLTPTEMAALSSAGPSSSTASTFSSVPFNGDVGTIFDLEPRPSLLPPTQRRGTKRPVAADFVDMEPGPSRPHPPGFARKPLSTARNSGSFASVSGMRRCVIDLSDSEEENEDETNGAFGSKQGSHSPFPASARTSGTTSTSRITPPRAALPPDLLQKEREIQRMRELIAEKEQRRLRKLAESSRPSSVLCSPSMPRPTGHGVSSGSALKLEDDEVSATILALHHQEHTAVPFLNGDSEKMEEDSVMRDLAIESQDSDDPTSNPAVTPEAVALIGSHPFQFIDNAHSN